MFPCPPTNFIVATPPALNFYARSARIGAGT